MPVKIKRVYDKPSPADGIRTLVDGLWPRGITKEALKISKWEKGVAPSQALRKWYGHEPDKWPEFRTRYRKELTKSPRKEALDQLVRLAEQGELTLVFGARNAEHSNAAVIAEVIRAKLEGNRGSLARASRHSRKANQ